MKLLTVVELPTFINAAKRCLEDHEREQLIFEVACHPEAGDVIPGTGGVRKRRFALEGRGKSGSVRVVYLYRDDRMPTFLITVYAKANKANLTAGEKEAIKKLVDQIVEQYKGRRHE